MVHGDVRTWRCSFSRRPILGGTPIKLFNHGNMRRDFTYVDDVTEAIVRLMDRPPQPDPEWSGDRPDPGKQRRAMEDLQHRQ